MRKRNKIVSLSLVLLLAIAFSVPVYAAETDAPADMAGVVKLTDKQKKDLASQYKEILKREHKVIATYVKYGVLTKEQGQMISSHLDKRYMKLEQSGFIPHWGKHDGKHHMKDHKQHHHKQHEHRDTPQDNQSEAQ